MSLPRCNENVTSKDLSARPGREYLPEYTLPPAAPHNRFALYAAVNVAFCVVVGIACAVGAPQNPRILYLILMFALCSSSIIDIDGLNGRYSLLGIFLFAYFIMYGLGDLGALAEGAVTEQSRAPLSVPEIVILIGGAILVLAYRLVISSLYPGRAASVPRDWSFRAILFVGFLMWAVGSYGTYQWYVHIVTDTTNEAVQRGLHSRSGYDISANILAQMMQPLGILLIAYAWRAFRLRALLLPVVGIVAFQVFVGFVADIKGLAMLGGILVIVTATLIDNRVPKLWLACAVAYAILVFPIFQAYRTEVHGNRGIARTAVVENFGKILQLALSAENRVNSGRHRAQTLLERSSLRASVQMIVERTGNGVPYQDGYTLTPLAATFIPKIIWPDKPDVPTGQLVNKEFHVAEGEDVYISPSHLGELYWNFGWPGVLMGMSTIGGILGFVGARFNLGAGKTVTRLLIVVVTIKQVVMGFEGVIAASYVVWLRSMAGIGLLHLLLARLPARSGDGAIGPDSRLPAISAITIKLFANLMD
ncbi:MAG: hypothetical protein M3N97_15750 [Pseudomonadota bacterium]|nr:hypothetical protein [Pseudomonadota bacterium]